MGWTSVPKDSILKPMCRFFEQELNCETDTISHRIIDSIIVNRNEAYLAYEDVDKRTGASHVKGMVVRLKWNKDGSLMYKEMSEDTHPYFYRCPARILELLTPTDNEDALAWRHRCVAK